MALHEAQPAARHCRTDQGAAPSASPDRSYHRRSSLPTGAEAAGRAGLGSSRVRGQRLCEMS
jgi:hypothetical protein